MGEKCWGCGDEHENAPEQMWLVTSKESVKVLARCQLEAWDKMLGDKSLAWFISNCGLVVTAKREGGTEDDEYAIHTVGLLVRYRELQLADAFDRRAAELGYGSVIEKYTSREGWVLPEPPTPPRLPRFR